MSHHPLPFQFGVSEFTTMPWSFEEDVAHYAAAGVDAIEICEFKLDPGRLEEQFALVRDKGLKICAIQAKVRTFFDSRMTPDPKGVADRTAALKSSIARLSPFAPGVTFITNTGAHPKGDMAQAMSVVTETLKALGPFAGDHGVTVALEPLNPTSVNVESAIWTVDQALDIIEATGRDEIGLCLDLWNVWQNANLEKAIVRGGDRILSLQVGDWRTPRSFADRIVPGDGDIPLGPLVKAAYSAGFEGVCTVELFSNDVADSLYKEDLDAVLGRCRAGVEAAWAKVS
jgi:sugar phosphate isomerase/epimerase